MKTFVLNLVLAALGYYLAACIWCRSFSFYNWFPLIRALAPWSIIIQAIAVTVIERLNAEFKNRHTKKHL